MLGSGGAYLGFVTGNLTAMKVPAALRAMHRRGRPTTKRAGDLHHRHRGQLHRTTLILAAGMLLLSAPPHLESPVLAPASPMLPALGGLAVVFLSKPAHRRRSHGADAGPLHNPSQPFSAISLLIR